MKNVVSRIIVWIVIVNPVTKFALDLSPIALGVEGYLALTFGIPMTVSSCPSYLLYLLCLSLSFPKPHTLNPKP